MRHTHVLSPALLVLSLAVTACVGDTATAPGASPLDTPARHGTGWVGGGGRVENGDSATTAAGGDSASTHGE